VYDFLNRLFIDVNRSMFGIKFKCEENITDTDSIGICFYLEGK
jgi:hypothetical protein